MAISSGVRSNSKSPLKFTTFGGKVVKVGFVMELAGFGAKDTVLKGYDVESLISYPDK